MKHIENNKVFHGCCNKSKDGTNKIIEKDKGCINPTSYPFWKRPWDVPHGIRTRSKEKIQKKAKLNYLNKYFGNVTYVIEK